MTALALIAVLLLVLANAFFVLTEYALVRSRRGRLEELAEGGRRGARLALSQLDDISSYISAIQVGITMASIGIGALGEPVVADLLEPIFGKWLGHAAAVAISTWCHSRTWCRGEPPCKRTCQARSLHLYWLWK